MTEKATTENPVSFELNRRMPATTDLSQARQGKVAASCYAIEHEHTTTCSTFGFRYALEYLAGLDQKKYEKDAALRFIETVRGTPAFTDFLRAVVKMQNGIMYLRTQQEAQERRQRGPLVEDAKKSARDLAQIQRQTGHLTKSFRTKPVAERLRLVK